MIAERISQGYFVDAQLDLERMAEHGVTVDEAMPTVRFAIGGDNVVGIQAGRQDARAAGDPVLARVHRHARQGPEHAGDHRRRAVRGARGEIADVAVREAPEMIRNDNGELAGLHLRRTSSGMTAPEYVDARARYLASESDAAAGLFASNGPGLPIRGGRALARCASSCRSRSSSCSCC